MPAAGAAFRFVAPALAAISAQSSAAFLNRASDCFRSSSALRLLSASLSWGSPPAAADFGTSPGGQELAAALGGDGTILDVGIIGETPGTAVGGAGAGFELAGSAEDGASEVDLSPVQLPHVSSESAPEESVSLASRLPLSTCASHLMPC